MEWLKDYWFVLVVVLAAAMVFFGYKTKGGNYEHAPDSAGEENRDNGRGCCC